jgi:hypothetical protein
MILIQDLGWLEGKLLDLKEFSVEEIDDILLEIEDGEYTVTELSPNQLEVKTNSGYEFELVI